MEEYDLVVVGAGPGGYVSAIRAGQLGLRVCLIEREAVGGVCLNWGCIPSKALIRNAEVLSLFGRADEFGIQVEKVVANYAHAVDRSRGVVETLTRGLNILLRKWNVELIKGQATLLDAHTVGVDTRRLSAGNIILATGARPRGLPGVEFDGELVFSYRDSIINSEVPDRVLIVGGGAIGVEFAYIYNSYGANVSVVEALPRILPGEDKEISDELARSLEQQGIRLQVSSTISEIQRHGQKGAKVILTTPDGSEELVVDRVLVAVGIQANTDGLGLEAAGVELNGGFIGVNERLQTNVEGVFAIGDVTGVMTLAHVAQTQGAYVVEGLAGEEQYPLNYEAMPRAIYCRPQVASFGVTEEEAQSRGIAYKVGRFPLSANGKALAMGEKEGLVKILVDPVSGELIGAHLIGQEVTEILGELSLARIMEGTHLEVGMVVNAHPTISEAVKEAALSVVSRAVHI